MTCTCCLYVYVYNCTKYINVYIYISIQITCIYNVYIYIQYTHMYCNSIRLCRMLHGIIYGRSYVALLRQLPKLGNSWMQLLEIWNRHWKLFALEVSRYMVAWYIWYVWLLPNVTNMNDLWVFLIQRYERRIHRIGISPNGPSSFLDSQS